MHEKDSEGGRRGHASAWRGRPPHLLIVNDPLCGVCVPERDDAVVVAAREEVAVPLVPAQAAELRPRADLQYGLETRRRVFQRLREK